MKKYLYFLFIIALSSSVFAQTKQEHGPYIGIINSIKFIDDEEKHGFVGTAKGLYETKDGGATWSNIDGNLPNQSYVPSGRIYTNTHPINTIATIDGKLMYVLYKGGLNGAPLFVTKDGGKRWENIDYPEPHGTKYIKLLKNNDLILYNGYCLYRKGISQEAFEQLSCPYGSTINYVNDNLIISSPSQRNPLENFKKSIDGGKHWIPLSAIGRNLGAPESKIDVNGNKIYILKKDSEGTTLVVSNDEGVTWKNINIDLISKAPQNGKIKNYVTTLTHEENGQEYIGISNGYLYSIDENSNNLQLFKSSNIPSPGDYKNIYHSVYDIYIKNRSIWIGTDFGLYRGDINESDINIQSVEFFDANGFSVKTALKNVNTGTLFTLQQPRNGVYGYLNNSLFKSNDNGISWKPIKIGKMISITNMYLSENNELYVLAINNATTSSVLYKSEDEGESWNEVRHSGKFFCSTGLDFNVTSALMFCAKTNFTSIDDENDDVHHLILNKKQAVVSFKNQNEGFAITSDGVYLSLDGGINWVFKGSIPSQYLLPLWRDNNENKPSLRVYEDNLIFIDENRFQFVTRTVFCPQPNPYGQFCISNDTHVLSLKYNEVDSKNGKFEFDNHFTLPCPEKNCKTRSIDVTQSLDSALNISTGFDVYQSTNSGLSWSKLPIQGVTEYKHLIADRGKLYFIAYGDNLYNNGLFSYNY